MIPIARFRRAVWEHYREHGRRDLPWRRARNPYQVLISEVMLQQTQVSRTLLKYKSFIRQFSSFRALHHASTRAVLAVWQGLGYNRRALFLKKLAATVVKRYGGALPRDPAILATLPGIGKATAGAIASFAFDRPVAFVETNIRRAIIHRFFPRARNVGEKKVLAIAERALDCRRPRVWNWALMDYGAMLGKILPNPNRRSARYRRQPAFSGSERELRGKIMRNAFRKPKISLAYLAQKTGESHTRIARVVATLAREGFLKRRGRFVIITDK